MSTETRGTYQLFNRLRPEEYAALEADILKRGILIPVERDTDGNTLDGHHREEIANKHDLPCPEVVRHFDTEADKREHVIKLNLARRHLAPHEWGGAFKLLLEAKGVDRGQGSRNDTNGTCATIAQVAESCGVPVRTAKYRMGQHDTYERLPEPLQQEVDAGKANIHRAFAQAKRERRREEAVAFAATAKADDDHGIVVGDFKLLWDRLEDSSVDMFLTDPVWQEVGQYEALAKLAAAKLKPKGLCLAYVGNQHLPRVFAELGTHLAYWRLFSLKHGGNRTVNHSLNLAMSWRPVPVFYKPPMPRAAVMTFDFWGGGGTDKQLHEWGHAEADMRYWVEQLTEPGALIVDPFCGGGTFPALCKRLGRRWLATEIDPDTAAIARKRLSDMEVASGKVG